MARLRPKQALKSIFCLLVFLLAGSFELSPAAEAFSCSGNSTTQQVVEYSVSRVAGEYIVHFSARHSASAREGFIAASAKSHPTVTITVLPRDPEWNPMANLPSDFDVVSVSGEQVAVTQALEAVTNHRMVKSVTQQKMLTRFLKEVAEDGNGEEEADTDDLDDELE